MQTLTFQPLYLAPINDHFGSLSSRRESRQASLSHFNFYWRPYPYKAPGARLAPIGTERQIFKSLSQTPISSYRFDKYYLPGSGHPLARFELLPRIPHEHEEIDNPKLSDLGASNRQVTGYVPDDAGEDWCFRTGRLDKDTMNAGNAQVIADEPGWMKQYANMHKWLVENSSGPISYGECAVEASPNLRHEGDYGSEGGEDYGYCYLPDYNAIHVDAEESSGHKE